MKNFLSIIHLKRKATTRTKTTSMMMTSIKGYLKKLKYSKVKSSKSKECFLSKLFLRNLQDALDY